MEKFLFEYPAYVVLVIALVIWAGLAIFLFSIDRKLKNLETNSSNNESSKSDRVEL